MMHRGPSAASIFCLLCLSLSVSGQQWTTNTSLPAAYTGLGLCSWNGFLYQTGGLGTNGSEYVGTNTHYAAIQTNGMLQTWKSGPAIPTSTFDHSSVAADGYLYVLGGDQYNGSALTVSSQVLSSVINLDGSLGAWRTNTPLPLAVSSMGVAVWNHTIYVMGGINSQAFLISSQVFSATIQSNGTLSAWSTLTPLPSGLEAQGAAANGVLYAFGGTDGTSYLTAVYYSAINPDGSLAGWNQTTALPHPSVYLGSAAGSGYVFSTGGSDGTNTLSSLYLAPVMGGGAAGAWSNGPALPQPLEIFGCAVAGSNLYVAGGQNSGGAQSTVYSLPLPTAPISANLTGEGRSTNGNFQFKLSSSPNTGFGLRASPDLSNWTTIGWGFTDTNGSLTLQDTNTTAASSRFYRTYWPLP